MNIIVELAETLVALAKRIRILEGLPRVTISNDLIWENKGDLSVGTGNDTAVVIPVGIDDQVLTADSTTATGVKWADASSGGHIIQEEGGALAQQPILNFIGAGVTATDNPGTTSTDVTILGGNVATDVIWDSKGDIAVATGPDAAVVLSAGADAQILISDDSEAEGLRWIDDKFGWTFVIGNNLDVIGTGYAGFVEVPYDVTLESVRLVADPQGSIEIDIYCDTYANFPPDSSDSITGTANYPILSNQIKYQDSVLTGWTKNLDAGDWLAFDILTVDTVLLVSLSLRGKKRIP